MFVNQREKLTLDQESLRALFHAPLQLRSFNNRISEGSFHPQSLSKCDWHDVMHEGDLTRCDPKKAAFDLYRWTTFLNMKES